MLDRLPEFVAWKLASHNPTTETKLLKLNNGRTRFLSQAEAVRLLAACNDDFRDVVLLAMHTGLRSNEIKTLRWYSIDMVRRTLSVTAEHSKNKDVKTVPMTEDVYQMFKRLQTERDRIPDDLVFVSRYNTRRTGGRLSRTRANGLRSATFTFMT